ncbi:MAG: hypothetical protein U1F87_06540 [Kiritimatiellia bacterium]
MPRPHHSLFCVLALAAGPAPARETGFREHMQPFLEEHCVDCHNATKQKGRVSLTGFDDDPAVYRSA